MLDKEIFMESLKEQYKDDVKMIIHECQFAGKTYLDVEGLNSKLKKLHNFALNEGLSDDDWYEIIYQLAPEIYEEITFMPMAA